MFGDSSNFVIVDGGLQLVVGFELCPPGDSREWTDVAASRDGALICTDEWSTDDKPLVCPGFWMVLVDFVITTTADAKSNASEIPHGTNTWRVSLPPPGNRARAGQAPLTAGSEWC